MRRTLALAGAAVLAVGLGVLAGPVSADTGIAQQEPEAVLHEAAVDLNSGFEGSFVEVINTNPNTDPNGEVQLQDYELRACSATGSLTELVEFDSTHVIPAGEHFLIADPAYANGDGPDADIQLQSNMDLDQSAGGILLMDTSASLQDSAKWGSPTDLNCASFVEAQDDPTVSQSINRVGGWVNDDPTPTNSAGETS